MQLISSKLVDKNRWDNLITQSTPNAFFSYSWYMDSICTDWSIFLDENYTRGIAVALKKQGLFTTLFTPNFSRYSEFIGTFSSTDLSSFQALLNTYSVVALNFNTPLLQLAYTEKVFQLSTLDDLALAASSQAKKAWKKAIASEYEIKPTWDETLFFESIALELGPRDKNYLTHNLSPLKHLIHAAEANGTLVSFGLYKDRQFLGACHCIRSVSGLLYLKGICTNEAKLNGGMHLMFNHIKLHCLEHKLILDFGGSNLSGIRQFFMYYGGKDISYFCYHRSLKIITILKKIKQWLTKK